MMLYDIGWVNYLYNFFLGLISISVTFLIIITIIYNIYTIEIIKDKININNTNIIFFFCDIIIISNINLFIGGVRFKLEIRL